MRVPDVLEFCKPVEFSDLRRIFLLTNETPLALLVVTNLPAVMIVSCKMMRVLSQQ